MSSSRILIVDDDKDSCELLAVMLCQAHAQYIITSAETTEKALDLLSNQAFDLYILDYWLPVLTGIELCRKIRRTDKQTPIMFYTAMARAVDRDEAVASGANEYLVNPNDMDKLIETVERLLYENNSASNIRLTPNSKDSLW